MNEQEHSSRRSDHESDPAHTPGDGWVGEGGASHLGPATHLARDNEEDESEDTSESLLDEL